MSVFFEEGRYQRHDLYFLLAMVAVSLAIRLFLVRYFNVISADGIGYARIASDIFHGKGFAGSGHFPPFYPILVGSANLLIDDIERAGRIVSIIMGSLVIIPVYLIGSEFYSKRAAIIAVLLTTAWPSILSWSVEVMSQSTYMFLVLTAIYILWRASRVGSKMAAAVAGIFFALAQLTRAEGVIVLVILTVILLLANVRTPQTRDVAISTFVCWAAFFISYLPYIFILHETHGKWLLTGKSSATIADALGLYLGVTELKRDPQFVEMGYLDVILQYPDYIKVTFLKNISVLWSQTLPVYLWFLSLSGCFLTLLNREHLRGTVYLLGTFSPLVLIVSFFFIGPEYTQPYLPVLFIWSGYSMLTAENFISSHIAVFPSAESSLKYRKGMVSILLAAVFAANMYRTAIPVLPKLYHHSQDAARYDHKRLGLLLKKNLPQGSRIMTRWSRIGFYSGLDFIDMPKAPLEFILRTARENRVNYIIVDGWIAQSYSQFDPLSAILWIIADNSILTGKEFPYEPLPGVRLSLLYKEPSSTGMVVYKLVR